MASGQTTNLALNQWGASDRVTRADFNGDNSKIDAAVGALRTADTTMQGSISALQGSVSALQTAVAGKCSVIVGSYIGDGAAERTISLGVTPKAVLVVPSIGFTNANSIRAALAVQGGPASVVRTLDRNFLLKVVPDGFAVYRDGNFSICTNETNGIYNYVAFY